MSLQELAFVLTDALLLPCIHPTNEASQVSSDDCSHSRVGLEVVDKRLVHYDLLSRCPACVKNGGSCLYFRERAMPHFCQWLRQHVDWTLSLELASRLNIVPYLAVLSRSEGHACLVNCWPEVYVASSLVCCGQLVCCKAMHAKAQPLSVRGCD